MERKFIESLICGIVGLFVGARMAPKHVFQSLTVNSALVTFIASSGAIALSPNFWGKAANCADEFGAPGLATGFREMIPVVTGMGAIGAFAGRMRKGGLAFWTPHGVLGPSREDFTQNEVNVPIELTEIRSQTDLSIQAVGHLVEVVQGLQSKLDQVPVVGDIKGTIEEAVRSGQQAALPPVVNFEREDNPGGSIRNKLMEMI